MAPIRPDPMGALDLLSGVLLYYTASGVPEIFAIAHAVFLIFKGLFSVAEFLPLPPVIMIYIMGAGADVISAAILITGQPPILGEFKIWIAGLLFLKGVWSLLGFMGGMN
jgi:hypothetical protein